MLRGLGTRRSRSMEPVERGPNWRTVWRGLAALAGVASLPLAALGQAAGSSPTLLEPSEGPLAFLEPLIGTWTSDPGWLEENPGMEHLVPISFRWGPTPYSIIDEAALPVRGQLFTVSMIVWDPVSRRADFLATQSNDSLVFRGHYEALGEGVIRRTYDVHYPDGSVVPFRETFFFDGPDAFDWLTEWQPDRRWEPRRGNGDPEYRALRRVTAPTGEMDRLGRWMGTWEGDGGRVLSLRSEAPTPALTLSDSGPRGTRRGLLVWDPYATGYRSLEIDAAGAVERVAWSIEGDTLLRVVERFDTRGYAERRLERWTLDGTGACLRVSGEGEAPASREDRYCKGASQEPDR